MMVLRLVMRLVHLFCCLKNTAIMSFWHLP